MIEYVECTQVVEMHRFCCIYVLEMQTCMVGGCGVYRHIYRHAILSNL